MENFGNIKDTFNYVIFESVIKKNKRGKKIFSKFVKTLKENKTLSDQYLIYKNLQTKKFDDELMAREYIKENISLLKRLNKRKIERGNRYFSKILKESKIIKVNDSFYNNIEFLVNTKKTPSNIDKINECIDIIVKVMTKNEIVEESLFESLELPPSVLLNLGLNKFNLKYSNISESEKEIIKTILNGDDDEKEKIYKKLKRECIETIDKKLNESNDIDLKDKLLKVKDKLLNMGYDGENYSSDISKIYDLNQSII
jgi:hypothetical protein